MMCLCKAFFAKGENNDGDYYYYYDNDDDNIDCTMKHTYICNR